MNITNSPDCFIPVYPQASYEFSSLKDSSPGPKTDYFGAREIKSLTAQISTLIAGLFTASNNTSTNQSICYFTGVMGASLLINTATQVAKKTFQLTNKEADTLEAFIAGCAAPTIAAVTVGLPLPIERCVAVSIVTGLALGGSTYIAHSIYESYYSKNKCRSSTELTLPSFTSLSNNEI